MSPEAPFTGVGPTRLMLRCTGVNGVGQADYPHPLVLFRFRAIHFISGHGALLGGRVATYDGPRVHLEAERP
jgi:hypothetical protein